MVGRTPLVPVTRDFRPAATMSHFVYTDLTFEWDPRKAAVNADKHGVTFEATGLHPSQR